MLGDSGRVLVYAFVAAICNGEDPKQPICNQAAILNHLEVQREGCLLSLPLPVLSMDNLIQLSQSIVFV